MYLRNNLVWYWTNPLREDYLGIWRDSKTKLFLAGNWAIDWCVKNLTQLWIWQFYNHFSHFFTSYINIFYKTKVQTVILRCLTSMNLNWIKSYYMNHKKCVFQFWKKKTENLSFKTSPFWTICGHFLANT